MSTGAELGQYFCADTITKINRMNPSNSPLWYACNVYITYGYGVKEI